MAGLTAEQIAAIAAEAASKAVQAALGESKPKRSAPKGRKKAAKQPSAKTAAFNALVESGDIAEGDVFEFEGQHYDVVLSKNGNLYYRAPKGARRSPSPKAKKIANVKLGAAKAARVVAANPPTKSEPDFSDNPVIAGLQLQQQLAGELVRLAESGALDNSAIFEHAEALGITIPRGFLGAAGAKLQDEVNNRPKGKIPPSEEESSGQVVTNENGVAVSRAEAEAALKAAGYKVSNLKN